MFTLTSSQIWFMNNFFYLLIASVLISLTVAYLFNRNRRKSLDLEIDNGYYVRDNDFIDELLIFLNLKYLFLGVLVVIIPFIVVLTS